MVTSASMFVSCKDYDDDISENKSSINALQEQVSTLKTALDKAQSDATAANAALETLKQTVEGNSTAIREAAAKAASAMSKVEEIEGAIELAQTVLNGKADKSALNELATKVAGIDTRLVTVEGTVSTNTAAIGNLQTQINALNYLKELYPTDAKSISTIVSELQTAQNAIGEWEDEKTIAEKMNEMSTLVDRYTSNINVLTYLIERQLTSIVLKPEFYYGGIEGVEVPALRNYAPWNQTVTGKLGTIDEQWAVEGDPTKYCTIEQGGIAQYHINPSSANLVGYSFDFFGNAADVRSGEQFATPKTAKADEAYLKENFKDGILAVPFNIDYAKIKALAANKLPMIALQMSKKAENGKDTVVTSDYAMILPTEYSNLIIADNKYAPAASATPATHTDADYNTLNSTNNGYHLWGNKANEYVKAMKGTVTQAVPTHQVAYNSTLDLTKFVELHYTYSYKGSNGVVTEADQVMSRSIMKALGLKFKYDYIDYTMGGNQTSETVHMTLSNGETGENGLVTPNGINADGSRNSAATNSRVAIGRLPIVRVSLVDAHDHVLKVAYIKIEITDANLPIKEFNFDMADIYANCADVEETKTWNDIEYTIYTALGMSKAEFVSYYTIDGALTDLNQYYAKDNNKDEGSYVATIAATNSVKWEDFQKEKFGKFAEVRNSIAPATNVLKWSFTAAEITRLYGIKDGDNYIIDRETGLNTKAIERFVKFSDRSGRAKIFVKFTIPVGKLHFAVGEPGKKIPAYWFGLNGYTEQTNGMEVHISTVVPNTQNDDCSFDKKITDFFEGNVVDFGFDAKFTNFTPTTNFFFTTPSKAKGNAAFDAADDGTWTVKGVSGTVYTLAIAGAGTKIQATKANGTAITTPVDVVTINNATFTLKWGTADEAKDILNYKGRTGAAASQQSLGDGESFTAYLEVMVDGCYDPYIKNPYINARYLRPVNLDPTEGKTIQDAVDGGSKIDIMDLVTLHDWRWYDFAHKGDDYDAVADNGVFTANAPHYIRYYGVKVKAYTDGAVTDLDKEAADRVLKADPSGLSKLKAVNPGLLLSVDNGNDGTVKADVDDAGDYAGKLSGNNIVYQNNSGVVNDFHIYVPVYITYNWGADWNKCQKVWGVITVKKTVNTGE